MIFKIVSLFWHYTSSIWLSEIRKGVHENMRMWHAIKSSKDSGLKICKRLAFWLQILTSMTCLVWYSFKLALFNSRSLIVLFVSSEMASNPMFWGKSYTNYVVAISHLSPFNKFHKTLFDITIVLLYQGLICLATNQGLLKKQHNGLRGVLISFGSILRRRGFMDFDQRQIFMVWKLP